MAREFAFGYVVLPYDDVAALLRDHHLHQASQLVAQLFSGAGTELDDLDREGLLSAEGERHARLRRLVAAPFAPGPSIDFAPSCASMQERSLDALNEGKEAYVVDAPKALWRYPIAVICQHLTSSAPTGTSFLGGRRRRSSSSPRR